MRTTIRPLLAVAGLCLPALALLGPDLRSVSNASAPAAQEERAAAAEGPEEDVLHQSMEVLNDGLRELRGLLRGGDVDAMLPVLDRIEAAVVAGKSQTPVTVEAVPADQRAAFVLDFRSEQLRLLEKLCQLERLLLEGDVEAANEFLAAEVMSMKRPSHSRFKSEGGWTPR